jgi:uncharacterized protein (UPF0332 family)
MPHKNDIYITFRLQKAYKNLADAQLLYNNERYLATLNRCYYAIFNAAKALLAHQNINIRKHIKVKKRFISHYITTQQLPQVLGEIFVQAEELRSSADYKDDFDVSTIDMTKHLKNTYFFVETIEKVLQTKAW